MKQIKHRSATVDQAFDLVQKSTPRNIQTCDFHLKIIRSALRNTNPARFTAVENYEIGMLIGMIEETMTDPNPETLHGFIL